MIRILIVDDHLIIREGVAAILENEEDMALIGEAADGMEAVEQFRALRPDVILMDIQMPGLNGLQAIATIMAEAPAAKILVLTTYPGDNQASRALAAGASGYMLKSSLRKDMLEAIRKVAGGATYVDPDVAQDLASHIADRPLGDREIAVLSLVARGQSNKEVAGGLGISEETVKAHLKSAFAKLKVADRTHAVTQAIKRGMIEI
ncbi:response regulator transcription factor [Novosphingobium terrae]|uniref:response regulator transcription factor n=1 Tax=Novosphingobium terrae TaxID=2726189 RepID=UPI001980DA20|nr:response regulator transcription factor [Novosphingobium terrae]